MTDIVNVLHSAGVLKKKNAKPRMSTTEENVLKKRNEYLKKLQLKIENGKDSLNQRKLHLNELVFQLVAVKNLLRMNQTFGKARPSVLSPSLREQLKLEIKKPAAKHPFIQVDESTVNHLEEAKNPNEDELIIFSFPFIVIKMPRLALDQVIPFFPHLSKFLF